MSMTSGCTKIENKNSEFVAKTQILSKKLYIFLACWNYYDIRKFVQICLKSEEHGEGYLDRFSVKM